MTIRTDKPEAEIGLYDVKKQLAYKKWQAHRQLAETLHIKIKQLLARGLAPSKLDDIGGVVVYSGPGSFTGLRIGISVANAFALGLKIPIVGATGDDWQATGIDRILDKDDDKQVLPNYGGEVFITHQKK